MYLKRPKVIKRSGYQLQASKMNRRVLMILYKVEDLFRTDAINNRQRAVTRTMDAIYI